MKPRALLALALLLILGVFVTHRLIRPPRPPVENSAAEKTPPSPLPSTTALPLPPRRAIPLTQLADPAASPAQKAQRVYTLVQNYLQVMKTRGGPPLSTNAEYTRALTGKNPLRVTFLAPDNPAISPHGELLDAWSTPYFFHALAADSVEVVSAGPDRIPFNADDLIFPRTGNRNSLAPPKR